MVKKWDLLFVFLLHGFYHHFCLHAKGLKRSNGESCSLSLSVWQPGGVNSTGGTPETVEYYVCGGDSVFLEG